MVLDDLRQIFKDWGIFRFYFDPNFQAEFITQVLEADGFERLAFTQTRANFSPCMKTAERLIESRKLVHNGNRLLTWQLENVDVDDSNGEIRPIKPPLNDKETRQIDGWVAIFESLIEFVENEINDQGYVGSVLI